MAAKYRKVDPRTWTDERFRTLTPVEKLVALYAITAQSTRCGIFSFSPARGSEETGVTPSAFTKAFNIVVERLRWRWDADNRVLYLPTWWRYNAPDNNAHLEGCLKDLHDVPSTPLLSEFTANTRYLRDTFHQTLLDTSAQTSLQTSTQTCAPQEQEQDQEQKQEQDSPPTPSTPSTPPGRGKVKNQVKNEGQDKIQVKSGAVVPNGDGVVEGLLVTYRSLTGVRPRDSDAAYIGNLVQRHGADRVRDALGKAGPEIAVAKSPLHYLGGVVRGNGDRRSPRSEDRKREVRGMLGGGGS